MRKVDLHTGLSPARFGRYLAACGNDKRKAAKLYRANLRLSLELYGVISIFEVLLRNAIDRHYQGLKGENWLADAVQPGGYLDTGAGCEDSFHDIQAAIQKLGITYSHDKLVAKLTFGFWTFQFAPKEFAVAGSTLLNIFPARPFGTKQKKIYRDLIKINDMRNRIAHHEPICFDKDSISTARVERRYELILELLSWLGYEPDRILFGIGRVKKALAAINSL